MNRKGFTLVELLSSIAIMGMVATIACVNVAKIFSEKEKISTENKNSIIETAACVYVDLDKNAKLKNICLNTGCTISTTDLIKEGLLSPEDVDKYHLINISNKNNEKKCTIIN